MLYHKGMKSTKKKVHFFYTEHTVWQHLDVYAAIKLLGMSHSVADQFAVCLSAAFK
jgi:hypothetical protein